MSHFWHNDIMTYPTLPEYQISFPFIQIQWAMKIQNVFILYQYRWKTIHVVQNRPLFSLIQNRMKIEPYLTQWYTKTF